MPIPSQASRQNCMLEGVETRRAASKGMRTQPYDEGIVQATNLVACEHTHQGGESRRG